MGDSTEKLKIIKNNIKQNKEKSNVRSGAHFLSLRRYQSHAVLGSINLHFCLSQFSKYGHFCQFPSIVALLSKTSRPFLFLIYGYLSNYLIITKNVLLIYLES